MSNHALISPRFLLALCTLALGFALPAAALANARVSEGYGKLPLHFEANQGQTHEDVRFLSRGAGYSLYLTAGEAVLVLTRPSPDENGKRNVQASPGPRAQEEPVALRMALVGANRKPLVSGLDQLPGKANYFIGKDQSKWRTNVPTYGKVHYREVYPGIDLVYYGNQRQLEYDFVVAPGADPKKIVLGFKGAEKLKIDAEGNLVLNAAGGEIRQHKPIIYQEVDGIRHEIAGSYVRKGANRVGFKVATYDTSRPLVIDPVLSYSTYLGGSGNDYGSGIAVDADGNVYTTGLAASVNFPTTAGAFRPAFGGSGDAFVTKLDRTGSVLVYSTYLGGSGHEHGEKLAVDAAGNAYVTGHTRSTDFPTTLGAVQTLSGGMDDTFVAKLDPAGSGLVYSTYLGGGGIDFGLGIAVDADGNAHVTGYTDSTNFPVTAGAFQLIAGGGNDAFVTKLNPTGTGAVYSTYLGGSVQDYGRGIAVDISGNAYVAGSTDSPNFPTTPDAYRLTFAGGWDDPFVTKLNPAGGLVYSTYLGGSSDDRGSGIAVDAGGNAYIAGTTWSLDFPTTLGAFQPVYGGGAYDGYVIKLDPTGSTLVYSTYLGGIELDYGQGIAVDAHGNAYVTGNTYSINFPTTASAFQRSFGGGSDAFVTKLNPSGSALVYSSYLGGNASDYGWGIAVDAADNAYVAGATSSGNFPTTSGAFQPGFGGGDGDAFVARIGEAAASPATTTTRFEESAATYSGNWPSYGAETGTFSGGTVRASPEATATASFSFTGTAITWIGVKCDVCGIATVSIDGGAPAVVNTAGPGRSGSLTSEPVFSASGLAPDVTHTIVITATGTTTALQSLLVGGTHIAADAFDVTR